MTRAGVIRASLASREWPVARAPRRFVAYVLLIDAIALVWSLAAIVRTESSRHNWVVLGMLIVLALAFEEGARRAARLQLRLSSDLKRDMTSVWSVCAAVTLRPAFSVLLLVPVMTYVWFRQQRPAGELLHRKAFNASTVLIGCLTAGLVVTSFSDSWRHLPWVASGSVAVFVAIVVYTVVNRCLVTVGLTCLGVRGRVLLGSHDDNMIELATLCLGGLVSLAVLHQPWLAILVLAPMVTLQRGALVRELETAATTDAKTGLLNAVAWEQLAQRELARAVRENYSIALLIIDIDRFKLVNDRYGHLAGDTVLRGVGRSLAGSMREYDTIARFGGEEFVAILPQADDATALVIAERVRAQVNQLRVSSLVDGLDPIAGDHLAVSIGVACMPIDGEELSDLLHAADQALYGAKESGRNRVQLAYRGGGERPARVLMS